MMPAEDPTPGPEETLARLQARLQDSEAEIRLAAIQELTAQPHSTPALLHTLEWMALHDPSPAVRQAARRALETPAHRSLQAQIARLDRPTRQAILREIETWQEQGLLSAEQADLLRLRYNFDLHPAAPPSAPEPAPVSPVVEASSVTPAPLPAKAPLTLTQTLLSETSIKIALYLGAFFVIAAAAILAAVVESARLPILLIATLLFGIASLVIRPRLPQPGFVLFIVFSFLLPTDARVLADQLNLSARANAFYWSGMLGGMALLWGFATWFYRSRLFSLAAFVALTLSFSRLAEALNNEIEMAVFLLSLVTLTGVGAAWVLQRWQGRAFGRPLFLSAQIGQFLLSLLALIAFSTRLSTPPAAWHLLTAFYWLTAAGFYLVSDLVVPFFLFPWLAAVVLFPFPLMLAQGLSLAGLPRVLLIGGWGSALTLLAEGLRLLCASKPVKFARLPALPLLIVSLPVILTAAGFGFAEKVTYGFGCLLAGALLYAAVHLLQPRVYVWSISLLLGLGAYFSFYFLPFMEGRKIFIGYQFLIPSLLYLLPDLVMGKRFPAAGNWRWPLRAIGGYLAFVNLGLLLPAARDQAGNVAVAYGIYAVFFLVYALQLGKAPLGYVATASIALSVTFALLHFDLPAPLEEDAWLPMLTGLATLYCLGGWALLHGRSLFGREAAPWSVVLRISGLTLGGLVALFALVWGKESGSGYVLLIGVLFTVELFQQRANWLEAGPHFFFPAGLALLLYRYQVSETAWYLLSVGSTWLALDLVFTHSRRDHRPWRWPVRILAALATLTNTLYLLTASGKSEVALMVFAAYTFTFLILAILHRRPWLGYGTTLFSMLALIFAFRTLGREHWLLPLAVLSGLYYGAGFFLRRRGDDQGWPLILWSSGIGIGLIASGLAPFHTRLYSNGLIVTIPPALTATLIAAEAFARRNVWLGFPANALYLLAYFIVLIELQVNEPQYYSTATAGLGLLMHYLLTRAGSKTGAFVTGTTSQLILLGTTFIQFLLAERLVFFTLLFFQALAVLIYGIVIRSRSLVITPILFTVLAVILVMRGLMQGIWTVLLIGCTGLLLLTLGILAVILRERLKQITEHFSDWRP